MELPWKKVHNFMLFSFVCSSVFCAVQAIYKFAVECDLKLIELDVCESKSRAKQALVQQCVSN